MSVKNGVGIGGLNGVLAMAFAALCDKFIAIGAILSIDIKDNHKSYLPYLRVKRCEM
jgi:hypothetical protein